MAAHDFPQAVPQGLDVEPAAEAQGGREDVGGAVRLELIEEPQPLLREGQGERLRFARRARQRTDRRGGRE